MVQATDTDDSGEQEVFHVFKLLGEMKDSVLKVTDLVDGMLLKVRSGEMSTEDGLSFLEMKYHMLLNYLINLTHIVLQKTASGTIENDPTIERLVEIRTIIEKIRPIDSKLKYQVNKLVKTAATGVGSGNDPSTFKANPDNLVSKNNEDSDTESNSGNEGDERKEKTGIYVPPKLAAMHFGGDDTKVEREKRLTDKVKKRALISSVMRELKEQYTDAPLEVSSGSKMQHAVSKQEQERIDYEENYLTRLPTTKEDKKRRKKLTTIGKLGDELVNFGDSFREETNKGNSKKRNKTASSKRKGGKKRRFH